MGGGGVGPCASHSSKEVPKNTPASRFSRPLRVGEIKEKSAPSLEMSGLPDETVICFRP